jgi:hypothetical protein
MLEDLLRRRGAEPRRYHTAGNIIAFLIACVFVGSLTATAGNVEIKFVVKTDEVEKAIGALGLDKGAAEKRTIYFFDTKDLSLFNQPTSIILRSRTTEGKDKGETTVKLRAKGALQIEDEWKQKERNGEKLDRKIEKDQVVTKPMVESYSLDAEQDAKEIDEVASSQRPIKKIFSKNQEDLVKTKDNAHVDWDELKALGPVKVRKWEVKREFSPPALTLVAERWKFGDHPPTLEVSTKVDETIAEETTAKLVKFMRDKGFEQDKDPETKTREVLEYFMSPK